MNKVVKIELSVKELAVITEALGEANCLEWLRYKAGEKEGNARFSRFFGVMTKIQRVGAVALTRGKSFEVSTNVVAAHKWLLESEYKGESAAWSAREAFERNAVASAKEVA